MKPCNGCGKCCLKYGKGSGLGCASENDLARLRDRPDIVSWIYPFPLDLWVSPATGEETTKCPWLKKLSNRESYKCRIHDVRPDVCRNYPVNIEQMVEDGCEMLEQEDLSLNPKQFLAVLTSSRNASAETVI